MKNKIFILVILSTLLLFSSTACADSETDDEVIRLKTLFNIGDEFESFDVNSSTNKQGFKSTSYNWSGKDKSIFITTDSKGNIIEFSKNTYDRKSKSNLLKSREDIIKTCDEFINKIDPNLSKSYKFNDININFNSSIALIDYNRYVNELKVINDNISLQVDLSNKEVTQFTRTYSSNVFKDGSFPSPDKAISKDQAIKLIDKEKPFYLSYLLLEEKDEKSSLPVYIQLDNFLALDAIDSKFIEEFQNYGGYGAAMDYAAQESKDAALNIVEKKEIDKLKDVKSLEEAKSFINKNFDTNGLKLQNQSLFKSDKDKYSYSLQYESENNFMEFILDAKDLTLLSYTSYADYPKSSDKEVKLEKDQAIKIALDFAKKFNTNKDIDLENPFINQTSTLTGVKFFLKKNNNYVVDNDIEIYISNSNKKVTSYTINVDNLEYKKMPNNLISKDKANNIAKDNLKLVYSYVKDSPKLIYVFDDTNKMIIKADDGSLINSQGEKYIENDITYKNIDSSKYKDEILYLSSINIGLPGNRDLKEKINIMDYVYLLNSLSGPIKYDKEEIKDSVNFYELEDLNKDKLDNNLLREDAVKWLMNQKSYTNLKNVDDVFNSSTFKDSKSISNDYKAYFYIAKGLGIYDYDTASPKNSVSIEEALHFIYKSL